MQQVIRIDTVDVLVEGDGTETMVMLHGWPDTYRLWDRQVAHFKDRYRCVRFTLPGSDVHQPCRAFSLAETVGFVRKVIGQVAPGQKVILLLHDWGCIFGYQLAMQYPALVSRVIGIDVGEMRPIGRTTPFKGILMLLSYFSWLALAWRLGGRAGDRMTRWLAGVLGAPADPQQISCCMNYPYYMAVTGAAGFYKDIKHYRPACPTLYLYGRHKPVQFHSEKWIAQLARQPGCRVQALDGCHWLMLEQAPALHQVVDSWLAVEPAAR